MAQTPLERIEAHLDAVPRTDADAVEVGPWTLFVGRGPFGYYARPRTTGHAGSVEVHDVAALADACAARGVRLAVEWLDDLRPDVTEATAAAGLVVQRHPLLWWPDATPTPGTGTGPRIRIAAGRDELARGRAVADVGFTAGGTSTGPGGAAERDVALDRLDPALVDHLQRRADAGLAVTAVAGDAGDEAVGTYHRVAASAEVLGVATLPSARRRGLAGAVTLALVAHARRAGVGTIFLSAEDEEVARVYRRVGFVPVGTACAAEPPD